MSTVDCLCRLLSLACLHGHTFSSDFGRTCLDNQGYGSGGFGTSQDELMVPLSLELQAQNYDDIVRGYVNFSNLLGQDK